MILGGMCYPHCIEVMKSTNFKTIIVPSTFIKNCCLENGVPNEKIRIISNGIDLSLFAGSKRHYDPKGTKYILVPSRMDVKKGVFEAVDFVKKIELSTNNKYTLIFCFDSNTEFASTLERYSHENNVDVIFNGWTEYKHMNYLYSLAWCTLLIGSAQEGFGLAYIESILSGTPVITKRIGNAKDIIPENHGLFFVDDYDVDSIYSVCDLIRKINCTDDVIRGINYIRDNYSIEAMLSEYEKVVDDHICTEEYW